MQIGISLPNVGGSAEKGRLIEVAELAEQFGFHSVWTSDHVALPLDRRSVYPYPQSTTEAAFTPGVQWLDSIAVMGLVTGVTSRVGIGTSVLVLPYRNPVILANEVASLDALSDGRILLGVGAGWMDEEFTAIGISKAERGKRTDETITLLRELWKGGPTTFKGRFFNIDQMQLACAPRRVGGPPIYVGGNSPAALRRAGSIGDGWQGFEVFLEEVRDCRDEVERAAKDSGRDFSSLTLSVRRALAPPFEVANLLPNRRAVTGTATEVADEINRYRDEGISLMVFDISMPSADRTKTMDWFASQVNALIA